MVQTAEQKKEYKRLWRLKNKEKIKEYRKEYYKNNKEYHQEYNKEWNLKNKEYKKEYKKEYYLNNKEKIKEYEKTPQMKKTRTIRNWKKRGLICPDIDSLYCHYLNATECENCYVTFGEFGDKTGTWRVMDHDHQTGLFRNFLCHTCNLRRR